MVGTLPVATVSGYSSSAQFQRTAIYVLPDQAARWPERKAIQALPQLSDGPATAGSAPGCPYDVLPPDGQRERPRVAAGAAQVAHGIDRGGADADLVVQVRSGRAAGLADGADHLPGLHAAADVGVDRRQVRVHRLETDAVVHHHHVAVAAHAAGIDDGAATRGGHRRAAERADVEAGMELPAATVR